jgi:hypothetical protein
MAFPYYNNYPQYNQPQPQYQTQQQAQMQMQTAGCMMVPTEEEVQKYPVAPNTAMVFLLQDLSACYIKATGASMLDAPRIQKYVRDDQINTQTNVQNTQKNSPDYAVKADIEKIQKQIDSLNEQVRPLLRNTNNNRKPEVKNNEQ